MSVSRSDVSRRGFVTGLLGAGVAAALGTTLSGCASDAAGLRLGKPVKGGAKTVPATGIPYKHGYVGPMAAHKGRITTEPATLRVLVMQDAVSVGDWNTNTFTKWYEQRTGVKVHWQVIAPDDSMTKINAMIAAGEVPDVLMPNPPLSPSQVLYYGKQGLFRRLNELIDGYGTETRRVFRQYPQFKDPMTAPDGSIYALPYVNDCFHCHVMGARTWIYTPWLEKLGLSMPETTEQFEEALHGFKHGNVNGDGKKDVIPFAISTDPTNGNSIDQLFMNPFLYNPGYTKGAAWLVLNGGRVEMVIDKPEWREGLKYMNRLCRKGLLDPLSFTRTSEQMIRIGDNKQKPLLGCSMGNIWASFMTMDMVSPKARWRDYHALTSLKGPEGVQYSPWNAYAGISHGRYMITSACKNPEIAMMWGDGLMELEATQASYSGPRNKDWRWAKPGEKGIDGDQGLWYTFPSKQTLPVGDAWGQMGMQYRSNDYRLGQVIDKKAPTFEKQLYDQTRQALYPYRVPAEKVLPPQYMTADQVGEASEAETVLMGHVRQSLANFTIGKLDPNSDRDWQEYVDTCKRMGIDRYVKVQQAAYDAKYRKS